MAQGKTGAVKQLVDPIQRADYFRMYLIISVLSPGVASASPEAASCYRTSGVKLDCRNTQRRGAAAEESRTTISGVKLIISSGSTPAA